MAATQVIHRDLKVRYCSHTMQPTLCRCTGDLCEHSSNLVKPQLVGQAPPPPAFNACPRFPASLGFASVPPRRPTLRAKCLRSPLLQLENVLLTSTDLSKADAKLADFGLARLLQSSLRREVTGPSRL